MILCCLITGFNPEPTFNLLPLQQRLLEGCDVQPLAAVFSGAEVAGGSHQT